MSIMGDFNGGACVSDILLPVDGLNFFGSAPSTVLTSFGVAIPAGNVPMSSLLDRLFNKWSNELVNDRFAFMKMVLPPK
jgi:hypothetical protein